MRGPRVSAKVRPSDWLRSFLTTRGSMLMKSSPCWIATVSIRRIVFSTAWGL